MNNKDRTILSVTDLNLEAQGLLENLKVWVKGEVQEYNSSPNWYYNYLVLKDEESQIKCVVTDRIIKASGANIEEGKEILLFGQVSLYPKRGEYQLKILEIEERGEGKLQKQIEELKKKLQTEGLFDEARKKSLPKFPEKIGVVASTNGAAFKDFKKIINNRFPLAEIILRDVFVQGDKAAKDVSNAINNFSDEGGVDIVVVTRGGGSIEDLMGYNSEEVARAIANSTIPIVSAIGHEKDITIADLAADHRSSTPSNAAEETVPDIKEVRQSIDFCIRHIARFTEKFAEIKKNSDQLLKNINAYFNSILDSYENNIDRMRLQILSLSPGKLLSRGYSLVYRKGKLVKKAKDVKKWDDIEINLHDGKFTAKRVS